MFKSLKGAVSQMVQIKDRFEPASKTAAFYTGHFQKYVGLYDSLVGMFAKETEAEG
jgi:hypothetical protein